MELLLVQFLEDGGEALNGNRAVRGGEEFRRFGFSRTKSEIMSVPYPLDVGNMASYCLC